MEEINGATTAASAHDMALAMVAYPVVHADDTAGVPVPVQKLLQSFWTSCDKCGFQFEYELKYLDHLMKCRMCYNAFVAKETVGRAHRKNKSVVHKGKVAGKRLLALPPTESSASVPESFHPIEGHLVKSPGADYKVQ